MYEASVEMLISKLPIIYCRYATMPFDVLAEMMCNIGKLNKEPETAAHSLLLVPLWHLLSGTLKKPFEMNTYDQCRHNSEKGDWWGLSNLQIKAFIKTDLKLVFGDANDNR